jgi:hypothetical protein
MVESDGAVEHGTHNRHAERSGERLACVIRSMSASESGASRPPNLLKPSSSLFLDPVG